MAASPEKVFVALPAEFKAGQSTLSWVLSHFGGCGATIVITHVHVPPQMIPVKCEKLVFEKEDVVAGLVELTVLHRVTRLVISAAADIQYSSFGFRKMDKPKSTKATEIMQRADPACKIWFICKGRLICTRGKEVDTAPSVTPLLPDFDHQNLQLVPYQKEDDVQSELGLYDELKEACIAAENLMKRALNESSRRQKADEEVVLAIQKANEYQELYLEEVRKRQELEEALARANREIAQLRQANHQPTDEQDTSRDELQEAISEELTFERHIVDMDAVLATAGQVTEPQEHVHIQTDLDAGGKELQALLSQCKPTAFSSPSSVIQSPYDEDCIPSYFLCPILQEPMRDPHVAADGFTYEADAIRGWLDGGSDASPVTGQPLAHRELAPNFALGAVIQDYTMRRRPHRFS
ncbi:hypothetical protein PVAP13_9NG479800 [Panicum virgatum]|uniref:RING-type E3 ubiquitin transferase n=1 Tax=Panicum virgatum TaxID=38727 RepID=A0A8T0MQJ4_PANVG|nr:hypothetical protein PVAP13_9NG479800 [Panicum virgatum]